MNVLQGYEPVIASAKGGKVPIDPKSIQEEFLAATSRDFLKDGTPNNCSSDDREQDSFARPGHGITHGAGQVLWQEIFI